MLSQRTLAIFIVGLLAGLSCRDPLAVSDCPDQVQVSVGAGPTPEIDWTPRCHLVGLLITAYGGTVWSIGGPQQGTCGDDGQVCYWRNTLYPPIRYGVVPRDVVQLFPPDQAPQALRIDWPYELRLSRGGRALPGEVWLAVDTFVVTATPGTPP
jgi:hypothetical protein